jgi:UDP-N-acetyl-D-mannosaminuronate dehydrogenase
MLHAAVTGGHCISMMPVFFIEKEVLSGELVPLLT